MARSRPRTGTAARPDHFLVALRKLSRYFIASIFPGFSRKVQIANARKWRSKAPAEEGAFATFQFVTFRGELLWPSEMQASQPALRKN